MKSCPQCHRLETDEALKFCRVDGVRLISDSGAAGGEAGTIKLGVGSVLSETQTDLLSKQTDSAIPRATEPTTVLPASAMLTATRDLTKPKLRGVVFGLVTVIILGFVIAGYFYFSRKTTAAIQSIAVMPFINDSGNADVES